MEAHIFLLKTVSSNHNDIYKGLVARLYGHYLVFTLLFLFIFDKFLFCG